MQYNRDYTSNSNYDPCASDNSMSGCYGGETPRITHELDYNTIGKNLNQLSKETIEILKFIEKEKFNAYGNIVFNGKEMFDFLDKYGEHLSDISSQLSEMSIAHLYCIDSCIKIAKITMDNIDVRFKSIYYESTESKNINFIRDATEMAKSGYNIYNVSAIKRDAKDSQGHYTGTIYKGFAATFIKTIN